MSARPKPKPVPVAPPAGSFITQLFVACFRPEIQARIDDGRLPGFTGVKVPHLPIPYTPENDEGGAS